MKYYEIYAWTECPYCAKAKELLISKNKQFIFCCIDQSDDLLNYLKNKYDWNTVPMIIEKDTDRNDWNFIGGYSDLCAFFEKEELENKKNDQPTG